MLCIFTFLQLNKKKFNFANFTSIYLNPYVGIFPGFCLGTFFSSYFLPLGFRSLPALQFS